jgi:predicted nuclease with TOPRIM domain
MHNVKENERLTKENERLTKENEELKEKYECLTFEIPLRLSQTRNAADAIEMQVSALKQNCDNCERVLANIGVQQ